MKIQKSALILIVLSIVMFNSCGLLEDNDGLKPGTCTVTVNGYLNKTFSGQAIFQNLLGMGGKYIFFLVLQDVPEPGKDYRFIEFSGRKPGLGKQNIYNSEIDTSFSKTLNFFYSDSQIQETYSSSGGTIEITTATSSILIGRADLKAYAYIADGNGHSARKEIKITAKFYAEEGNTGIILN